ncbi:hypothetical protein TWF718_010481 [Orbilia javanica]|uniref:F-box domain-containing protein n=1 Tax=Orbilia javanica TaxID=47235 RepID=A0AAN8RB40_9PEZI
MITEISKYLHQKKTLASLSLVSKKLNSIVSPLLYETVIINLNDFQDSKAYKYASLLVYEHRYVHLIKNFGVRGMKPKLEPWKRIIFHTLNCMTLGLLKLFESDQLRNFVWSTDMALTSVIVKELQNRQKLLQGIWVSSSDAVGSGFTDDSLFKIFNDLGSIRDLHFSGILDLQSLFEFLRNPETMPQNLHRLTIGASGGVFGQWSRSINLTTPDDSADINLGPASQSFPKFPDLKYLSLTGIDLGLLTEFDSSFRIDRIFDVKNLQTLKLIDINEISVTLNYLQVLPMNLKTFHIRGKEPGIAIENILGSFTGLEELYLDLESYESSRWNNMCQNIRNHKATLVRLYARLSSDGYGGEFGDTFLRSLRGENKFPKLLELCCPLKDFYEFRSFSRDYLPKLQLLWLLADPRTWEKKDLKPNDTTTILRPFFRPNAHNHNRLPFLAIGERSEKGLLLIFELCESVSITGAITTSLSFITHHSLFDYNPELTLLNIDTSWVPWEEEREFYNSREASYIGDEYSARDRAAPTPYRP